MQPIRVLIVDDSAFLCRQLGKLLTADPEIVVAGTACNGRVALHSIAALKPDLVTLDVEMPVMDGITALVEIRKRFPALPVIMFSIVTGPGAAATVEALARGASDYVPKPSQMGSPEQAGACVRQQLIPKIKALCAARARHSQPVDLPTPATLGSATPPTRIDVVAIGSSTGGPNALAELIARLPADFPIPIMVVQHMPAMFTRLLAQRLDALTSLSVREGTDGARLERGQVWIAPGDYHMTVMRNGTYCSLGLNQDPPENSCRPAVDVLFRSLVPAYGANVLGVVLTGMGSDGTRGSAAIREAGGTVIAQDEASSVVWGMPGSIVAAGLANRVIPLNDIALDILCRTAWWKDRAAAARG